MSISACVPNNQIDAHGCSPLECGGLTPLFLAAAQRDIDPMSFIALAIAFQKEIELSIGARCQATANESGVKPPQMRSFPNRARACSTEAFFLHPRKGMNVSSRRCNLRTNAKEEKENSPERAEHSPMEAGVRPVQGREEYQCERIPQVAPTATIVVPLRGTETQHHLNPNSTLVSPKTPPRNQQHNTSQSKNAKTPGDEKKRRQAAALQKATTSCVNLIMGKCQCFDFRPIFGVCLR